MPLKQGIFPCNQATIDFTSTYTSTSCALCCCLASNNRCLIASNSAMHSSWVAPYVRTTFPSSLLKVHPTPVLLEFALNFEAMMIIMLVSVSAALLSSFVTSLLFPLSWFLVVFSIASNFCHSCIALWTTSLASVLCLSNCQWHLAFHMCHSK